MSPGSVWMLQDVDHDVQQRWPGLGSGGDDLGAGQEEAVAPRVPQLKGEGIFHPVVVGPVDGGAICHVCRERRGDVIPTLSVRGGHNATRRGTDTYRLCLRRCHRCISSHTWRPSRSLPF